VPPSGVHFNGSVNLPDTETVFRELAARVGELASAYPDGETGDRGAWVFFQLPVLRAAAGIVDASPRAVLGDAFPQVRLADGVDAAGADFGDLGYAREYLASYDTFRRLREDGVVPAGTRFQVEYPTPTAVVTTWFGPEDHERVLPAYARALFADLTRLLGTVPPGDIEVQWDVAVEIGMLERDGPGQGIELASGLARCVDVVPGDVPVGLHLCYGDYQHQHMSEPGSLGTQVGLANTVRRRAARRIDSTAFTVPQYQDSEAYFEPLADLAVEPARLYFGIVPYHPDRQAPGTTDRQMQLIDRYVSDWGVCTECGMGRVDRADIPRLLDLHRSIVEDHATR
jgi:hypothetical protein